MRGDFGLDDVASPINGGRYSTRMREPADGRGKANGNGRGQDDDRFKWITAHTSKGPVLNSLWVVKGIIPRHGIGAMFGRPGGGKTFLATDIGLHVAAAFHGAGTRSFRWRWPTARWKRAIWVKTEFTRGAFIMDARGRR